AFVAAALALIAAGCGASPGSGGMGGSGAGGTGGGGTSCTDVTPCGGSVVGTWMISPSSCVALAGDLDGMYLSLGCSKIPVTGALTTSGTFTANADGTYIDDTTTTGSANFS